MGGGAGVWAGRRRRGGEERGLIRYQRAIGGTDQETEPANCQRGEFRWGQYSVAIKRPK